MRKERASTSYYAEVPGQAELAITSQAVRPLWLVVGVACLAATLMAAPKLPQPQGFVSDLAEKLSPAAKQTLETRLQDLKRQSDGIEVAVVTIPYESMGGLAIENYSLQLARSWGIGAKGKRKDGVLLLIAIKPPDEQGIYHGSTRLEVSRSLEDALSSSVCSRIIGGMHDDFVAGRFDQAIAAGVRNITVRLAQTRGFVLPPDQADQPRAPAQPRTYQHSFSDPLDGLSVIMGCILVAAIPFAVLPFLIFLSRSGGLPWQRTGGGITRYSSRSSWQRGADTQAPDLGPSYDGPVAAESAQASMDSSGSTFGADVGNPSGGNDFGSSSCGGGDFGSPSGGGDFGGGGASGNF